MALSAAAGAVDSLSLWGSLALLAVYGVLCCIPLLHNTVRAVVRPTVLRHVDSGLRWVDWAQSYHNPLLTKLFNISSHTVSVSFYITVLPFCIWIFGESLGWRLCFLMTATLYVGNSLKDLVCGPRPFSVARSKGSLDSSQPSANGNGNAAAHGAAAAATTTATNGATTTTTTSDGGAPALLANEQSEDFQVHAKEYGLPSSHTMNTLALNFYIVHYLAERLDAPPALTAVGFALAAAWVLWIAFSRMYLGFHTPIDIVVGAVCSTAILVLYSRVDAALDEWLLRGSKLNGLGVLAVLVVLMRAHPRPLTYTPSFEYTVSFVGVTFGIAAALRRTAALLPYMQQGPALLSLWGAFFAVRRLLTGFVVLFVMKEACKSSLLGTLPAVYRRFPLRLRRLWQPPLVSLCACQGRPRCSHREVPINAKGQPWDADITARFFAYASIGWAVVELAPRMFKALGW